MRSSQFFPLNSPLTNPPSRMNDYPMVSCPHRGRRLFPMLAKLVAAVGAAGILPPTAFAEPFAPSQAEIFVAPRDPAVASDLRQALADIRRQASSPEERVRLTDELFSLNRDILFRKVETRSPEQIAASLRSAAAASKAQAEKLAAARDGSPEAEHAVLRADVRTAVLETMARARNPEERIALIDALFRDNAEIIAEARKSIPRPTPLASEPPIERPPPTPEALLATQLREGLRQTRLSASSPEARVIATEQFLATHRQQIESLKSASGASRTQSTQPEPSK
jgi:hypothetical protein